MSNNSVSWTQLPTLVACPSSRSTLYCRRSHSMGPKNQLFSVLKIEPPPDGVVPTDPAATLPFCICFVIPSPVLRGFDPCNFCSTTPDFNSFNMTIVLGFANAFNVTFFTPLLPRHPATFMLSPCSSRAPTVFVIFSCFTDGFPFPSPSSERKPSSFSNT
ncbi:hypothetical protein VNO78_14050 [Psophocarpus tetragonolobus]|uniref:Uncharacterized protein n=1 Tax=Psophocarpus tetragonolobus TaxID=3891 RepID=A0AAN9SSL8_PSOTE